MVLESSRQQSVTIDSELEMLGLYLELEVIRFNRRFAYHIKVEESVDTSLHIPSMLIQPYAEYGFHTGSNLLRAVEYYPCHLRCKRMSLLYRGRQRSGPGPGHGDEAEESYRAYLVGD